MSRTQLIAKVSHVECKNSFVINVGTNGLCRPESQTETTLDPPDLSIDPRDLPTKSSLAADVENGNVWTNLAEIAEDYLSQTVRCAEADAAAAQATMHERLKAAGYD